MEEPSLAGNFNDQLMSEENIRAGISSIISNPVQESISRMSPDKYPWNQQTSENKIKRNLSPKKSKFPKAILSPDAREAARSFAGTFALSSQRELKEIEKAREIKQLQTNANSQRQSPKQGIRIKRPYDEPIQTKPVMYQIKSRKASHGKTETLQHLKGAHMDIMNLLNGQQTTSARQRLIFGYRGNSLLPFKHSHGIEESVGLLQQNAAVNSSSLQNLAAQAMASKLLSEEKITLPVIKQPTSMDREESQILRNRFNLIAAVPDTFQQLPMLNNKQTHAEIKTEMLSSLIIKRRGRNTKKISDVSSIVGFMTNNGSVKYLSSNRSVLSDYVSASPVVESIKVQEDIGMIVKAHDEESKIDLRTSDIQSQTSRKPQIKNAYRSNLKITSKPKTNTNKNLNLHQINETENAPSQLSIVDSEANLALQKDHAKMMQDFFGIKLHVKKFTKLGTQKAQAKVKQEEIED